MRPRLSPVLADITTLAVDAVVNAANSTLLGGGGVDGAIHAAAGPRLLEECRVIAQARGALPAGEAVITSGYLLPARFVVHTVGPVWYGGSRGEPEVLAACYRNCLELAEAAGCRTIAFPGISTGAYGYPPDKAARVAVDAVLAYFAQASAGLSEVVFACFDPLALRMYASVLSHR